MIGDINRFCGVRNGELITFQFNTLTFGVSFSPFLAIRVLQKLIEDEGHAFPRAAKVIKAHLYVDDLISGADSIDEVRAIRNDVIALLARGGFTIRQWVSNEERVVNDLAANMLHAEFVFDGDRSLKTLGITWRAREDELRYSVRAVEVTERLTKRRILSEIAKIFDPVGLLIH